MRMTPTHRIGSRENRGSSRRAGSLSFSLRRRRSDRMEIVVEQELSALFPDGRVVPIRMRVGRPHPRPTGEWACPVEVDGLPSWQGSRDIFGEGPLQALTLGLRLLRSALLDAAVRGTD